MSIPLPYLPRPREEAYLEDFLVQRLLPQPGLPKALLLCGPAGAGKKTLLRRVFESDPRLRPYRFADTATREVLTGVTHPGAWKRKAADALVPAFNIAVPVVAPAYELLLAVLGDELGKAPGGPTALDPLLEGNDEPLLLIVRGFDPESPSTLRALGHWINQSRDRPLPRALLILDESPRLPGAEPGSGVTRGVARLREYLRDDRWLDVLPVGPFSPEECRESFVHLGLPAGWAHVLHQLSDGEIPGLCALWKRLQEGGVIEPAGDGRWKALQSASSTVGWQLVQDQLSQLIDLRVSGDTIHKERLLDAFHLAACMGSTFLPQAVAEAVAKVDPKRDSLDLVAWEDVWYEVIEQEDAERAAIAPQCRSSDGAEILRGDARECFVHAFRDPALGSLLRSAARKMWDAHKTEPGRPKHLLVEAGKALETWLESTFAVTWPEALPFCAALLRIQRRDSEASRLEDLDYRLRLQEKLRLKIEQERRRVQQGRDAGDLYASLLWYAETVGKLGHLAAQVTAMEEALELVNAGVITLSTIDYLTLQCLLGAALSGHGAYKQAEPLLVRALNGFERRLGPNHTETLSAANHLGDLYANQRRYAEAEPLYLRALDGLERALGPRHPLTLKSTECLGHLYASQGRYTEAELLYACALNGREGVLGPDHPETLSAASYLGHLYENQRRYADAEPLYVRALKGFDQVLGPDQLDTLRSAGHLALLYTNQHRYEDAEPLYVRVLKGFDRVLGPDHPETLGAASYLGHLYLDQRRHAEAEPLYVRALKGFDRVLGPDHPDSMIVANNLASMYASQGRQSEAEPLYVRALEGFERVLGPDHWRTLSSANNLASLYTSHGRDEEAEPLFLRALEGLKRVVGPDHRHTLSSAESLASLYASQDRYAEAERLYARVLEERERVLGPGHPDTVLAHARLDEVRRTMSRSGDATQAPDSSGA